MTEAPDRGARWAMAATTAALLATDPAGLGGISVRALAGPARDAWLRLLRTLLEQSAPIRRLPANTSDDRLLGGLDLAATLQAGRSVAERGILTQADGGVVLLAMAERVGPGTAARLGMALDSGEVTVERDGIAGRFESRIAVVALDEGMAADERPPAPLLDRLAFLLDLDGLRAEETAPHTSGDVAAARLLLPRVRSDEAVVTAICATALALGVVSMRAALLTLRAARCCAALDGREVVSQDDATLAAALALAPRATRMPAAEPDAADGGRPDAERPDARPPAGRGAGGGPPPPHARTPSRVLAAANQNRTARRRQVSRWLIWCSRRHRRRSRPACCPK